MKVYVKVNGKKELHEIDSSIPIYKAIAEIRTKIKSEYKRKKQRCELWFIDIIK